MKIFGRAIMAFFERFLPSSFAVDTMEASHCVWKRSVVDPLKHLNARRIILEGSTADRYFKVRVVHNSLLA